MEDRYQLNKELAQMLKGGVIMDVTTPELVSADFTKQTEKSSLWVSDMNVIHISIQWMSGSGSRID